MKKICLFLLVMIFAIGNTFPIFAVDNEDVLCITTYDCNTGEIIESDYNYSDNVVSYSNPILDEINSSNIMPSALIGNDNRMRVDATESPYMMIGDIYMQWDFNDDGIIDDTTYSGTGFMMGPDVMVTAAHVVYWKTYECFPYRTYFVTERNGEFEYREIAKSMSISVSTSFIEKEATDYDGRLAHDWAIVILDTNVGDRTGWFTCGITSGSLNLSSVIISGYPDDDGKKYSQWCDFGVVTNTAASYFIYTADATGGQSGAPVYDVNNVVWGIHHGGYSSGNQAYRFSESVYGFIQDELAAGRERYPN